MVFGGFSNSTDEIIVNRLEAVYLGDVYCIVLYLYIYIARLAVHTNQKRFQCERPRKKRDA